MRLRHGKPTDWLRKRGKKVRVAPEPAHRRRPGCPGSVLGAHRPDQDTRSGLVRVPSGGPNRMIALSTVGRASARSKPSRTSSALERDLQQRGGQGIQVAVEAERVATRGALDRWAIARRREIGLTERAEESRWPGSGRPPPPPQVKDGSAAHAADSVEEFGAEPSPTDSEILVTSRVPADAQAGGPVAAG